MIMPLGDWASSDRILANFLAPISTLDYD